MLKWLMCLAFMVPFQISSQGAVIDRHSLSLGTYRGNTLTVTITAGSPHNGLSRVLLKFTSTKNKSITGSHYIITPMNRFASAHFYTGNLLANGHLQLLTSLWNGRCYKVVYDWNGATLRTIFDQHDGRVDARIIHVAGKGDMLAEYFPLNQWDRHLAGEWYYLPEYSSMVTMLKWRQGAFRPARMIHNSVLNSMASFAAADDLIICEAHLAGAPPSVVCLAAHQKPLRMRLHKLNLPSNSLIDSVAIDVRLSHLVVQYMPPHATNDHIALFVHPCHQGIKPMNSSTVKSAETVPAEQYIIQDKLYSLSPITGKLGVYNLKSMKKLLSSSVVNEAGFQNGAANIVMSQSGKFAAVLRRHRILIVSTQDHRTLYRIYCHRWLCPIMALSERRHCLVVAHGNKCTVFHFGKSVQRSTVASSQSYITDVALSRNGNSFATTCGDHVVLWGLEPLQRERDILLTSTRHP